MRIISTNGVRLPSQMRLENLFSIVDLTKIPVIRILDLGAMTFGAMTEPYSALQKAGIAKIIGFEAVESECEKLRATYPEHEYFPYFIGDGSPRTFHTTNHSMTSSLYAPNKDVMDMFENLSELVEVVRTDQVQTKQLRELSDIIGTVDYIKADVQGAECDVFANAGSLLNDVLVIQTEVEFVDIYKHQPLFSDVDVVLRCAGFQFHRFENMSGRMYKGLPATVSASLAETQQLWADAIYVKEVQHWDALSSDELLKMAAILHEIYGSFDLAHKALKVFDEKTSASLADKYSSLLASHVGTPKVAVAATE